MQSLMYGKTDRSISIGPCSVVIGLIFLTYMGIRLLAWSRTYLLEDTDSLFYLRSIDTFLTCDLSQIMSMSPDSTPFYPFVAALFSLPGWSVETGARMASLAFSAILFFALFGLGRKLGSCKAVAAALLVGAFSPVLVSNSYAVLTEPLYIGTVYIGLWLFFRNLEQPALRAALALGLVFGLAFLNRTEGIMYVVVIPFMQLLHLLLSKTRTYRPRQFAIWTLTYIVAFAALAAPQIWRVSDAMGMMALNGRQVHMMLLNNPDGKSTAEKLFGLNYSPDTIDLKYIQEHPREFVSAQTHETYASHLKRFALKAYDFYYSAVGKIVGPLGLIFFAFGIVNLLERGRGIVVLLIFVFLATGVAPELLTPQVKSHVAIRHILVVVPLVLLLAGIGLTAVAVKLGELMPKNLGGATPVAVILLLLWVGTSAASLTVQVLRSEKANNEYSPAEIAEPISVMQASASALGIRSPLTVAQRDYFSYYGGARHLFTPFTDYRGLINYLRLNRADFLYVKYSRVKKYPFFQHFLTGSYGPELKLLYSGKDAYGGLIQLFRVQLQDSRAEAD